MSVLFCQNILQTIKTIKVVFSVQNALCENSILIVVKPGLDLSQNKIRTHVSTPESTPSRLTLKRRIFQIPSQWQGSRSDNVIAYAFNLYLKGDNGSNPGANHGGRTKLVMLFFHKRKKNRRPICLKPILFLQG